MNSGRTSIKPYLTKIYKPTFETHQLGKMSK